VQVKYEGIRETPIKQDATLHETVESELGKENESKEKSSKEFYACIPLLLKPYN